MYVFFILDFISGRKLKEQNATDRHYFDYLRHNRDVYEPYLHHHNYSLERTSQRITRPSPQSPYGTHGSRLVLLSSTSLVPLN